MAANVHAHAAISIAECVNKHAANNNWERQGSAKGYVRATIVHAKSFVNFGRIAENASWTK